MNERDTFVSSDDTVRKNRKPNRKEPKKISFRVSVPAFVKKKAQGSRLVVPKFDKKTR